MDIGYSSERGIQAVINYLGNNDPSYLKKALKLRGKSFKSVVKSKTSLTEAIKEGFCSLDILKECITWDELRSSYNMSDLLEFGVTFDIASQIGLKPKYYGGDAGLPILNQMGATYEDLEKNVCNLFKLRETQWTPTATKKAGFTFEKLCNMGDICATMHNWTIKDIVVAYRPNGTEWLQAGFNAPSLRWEQTHFTTYVQPLITPLLEQPKVQNIEKEAVKKDIPKDYILQFDESKLNNIQL